MIAKTKVSELTYTAISDLASIQQARNLLREIVLENNPHVDEKSYRQVMATLTKWIDGISETIEIEEAFDDR